MSEERNIRVEHRKRPKNKKYKFNKKRLITLSVVFILILLMIFLAVRYIPKIFAIRGYKKVYEARYSASSLYSENLQKANENYFYDEILYENGRYKRLPIPFLNNKLEITLDKVLHNKVTNYAVEKGLPVENISISIVNMNHGDRFNFNETKVRRFPNTDKLLLSMLYNKLEKTGKIDMKSIFSLKEEDLTENSYFFKGENIGLTYEIKELLKLSFNNNDATSTNMLERYLVELYKIQYPEIVQREIGMNINGRSNTSTIIDLARLLYNDPEVYSDILYDLKKEERESGYLNYLSQPNTLNYINNNIEEFYDFGYIRGDISYIYAISTEGIPIENIREIGDLLDRSLHEYYILKSL